MVEGWDSQATAVAEPTPSYPSHPHHINSPSVFPNASPSGEYHFGSSVYGECGLRAPDQHHPQGVDVRIATRKSPGRAPKSSGTIIPLWCTSKAMPLWWWVQLGSEFPYSSVPRLMQSQVRVLLARMCHECARVSRHQHWRRAYMATKWEKVWIWNKRTPPPDGVEFSTGRCVVQSAWAR